MRKLIKEICKREGKKSQVTIGNVREVIRHFADIQAEYYATDGKKNKKLMAEWFKNTSNRWKLLIMKKKKTK